MGGEGGRRNARTSFCTFAGTLQPQSDIRIEIDFCSTSLKKYDCSLVVDVEGVGEEWLTVPIEAK